MKVHAALQAATGVKPSRGTDAQTYTASPTSAPIPDAGPSSQDADDTDTGSESSLAAFQPRSALDQVPGGAQSESDSAFLGSSQAQLGSSSPAHDEPEATASESDDNGGLSDSDLADPVIADAMGDSDAEEEPGDVDAAALRDADIQQMEKRAITLRGRMK